MRIRVERVDVVSVPTRDVARARRFYGEVLGLPAGSTGEDEFETPNVTLAQRLVEEGVDFLGETVDTGVCHVAFPRDPDGNVLILHRRYA